MQRFARGLTLQVPIPLTHSSPLLPPLTAPSLMAGDPANPHLPCVVGSIRFARHACSAAGRSRGVIPDFGIALLPRAQIQAQLGEGHVNIISAREVLLTAHSLAICMEYASGGNLTAYVTSHWPHAQVVPVFGSVRAVLS